MIHPFTFLVICLVVGGVLCALESAARWDAWCASGYHADPCYPSLWAFLFPPPRVYCDDPLAAPDACFPR